MNPQNKRRERKRKRARKMSTRSLKVFCGYYENVSVRLRSHPNSKSKAIYTVMDPEIVFETSACLKDKL